MRLIASKEAFSIPELDRRFPAVAGTGDVPVSKAFARTVEHAFGAALSDADRHRIAHCNAERLLRILPVEA